jgi:hypothetical protein
MARMHVGIHGWGRLRERSSHLSIHIYGADIAPFVDKTEREEPVEMWQKGGPLNTKVKEAIRHLTDQFDLLPVF